MTRRFNEGDTFRLQGIDFRVVRGKKGPADLRLDWLLSVGWQPVCVDIVGLIADFVYENENYLYPPPRFKGGEKFMAYIRQAVGDGYRQANHDLHLERAVKHHPGEHSRPSDPEAA